MFSALQKELIERIGATSDESLLQLIKTEIDYFTSDGGVNISDQLSVQDQEDLANLLSEPFASETESLEDFKKATERWRTK